ncbi:MAG: CubicO group peptidase (beta-lactamase class C family) [Porticoccaceae bacterium]|jgi:CubicO group peptidase (beta-lactamase class C family)
MATFSVGSFGVAAMRTARLTVVVIAGVLLAANACGRVSANDGDRSATYYPTADEWETAEPASVDWNADALVTAVDFAMSRKSSGVVILHRGRILAERYQKVADPSLRYRAMLHGKTADGQAIEDVASVQKSVASMLVGIAQEKGLVKLSDPVHKYLGNGWSHATTEQEGQITIRHLVSMSTGLTDRLRYADPPGTKWRYNTNAYCLSVRAVSAASGMTPNKLTKAWLTESLGMRESQWVERRLARISPPETNKLGFTTSARDLARFGLLVLAGGRWGQTKILGDKDYLRVALSPSQKMNPSYGYLWWLNGQRSAIRGGRPVTGGLNRQAPDDLVAALGALGRKCYVVPSLGLVVTRLGDDPESKGQPKFDTEFWRLLMKAAPNATE